MNCACDFLFWIVFGDYHTAGKDQTEIVLWMGPTFGFRWRVIRRLLIERNVWISGRFAIFPARFEIRRRKNWCNVGWKCIHKRTLDEKSYVKKKKMQIHSRNLIRRRFHIFRSKMHAGRERRKKWLACLKFQIFIGKIAFYGAERKLVDPPGKHERAERRAKKPNQKERYLSHEPEVKRCAQVSKRKVEPTWPFLPQFLSSFFTSRSAPTLHSGLSDHKFRTNWSADKNATSRCRGAKKSERG